MKKKIILLLGISTIFALSSCSSPSVSEETTSDQDTISNSDTSDGQDSTTTTTTSSENGEISLKMYGNLYINGTRTIYANIGDSTSEVIWSSSEPTIISASSRSDLTTECSLIAKKTGTSIITATLKNDSSISATYTVTVEEGEEMPEDKFKMLQGGLKLTSVDELLSFDKNGNKTVDSTYDVVTIYEETGDVNDKSLSNSTDAYQISAVNRNNPSDKFERTYVKTVGSYVGTEYLDMNNKINSEKVLNEDGEGIKFNSSYYINLLNADNNGVQLITRDQFRTYDGGKTFHYSYSYINSMYLGISYFGEDMAPDDMWFTFEENNISLDVTIDPYNRDVTSNVKYGRQIKSTITEIDTAKVKHVTPYTPDDSQIPLKNALKTLKESKNYVVNYKLDYPGTADDTDYKFIFTEDTIDQVVMKNGKIVNHSGAHASSNSSYFQYTYNDETSSLVKTKEYEVSWNSVNRYPTFDFSSEIFEKTGDYTFKSRGLNGAFIATTIYLSQAANFYKYEQDGTITLSADGKSINMNTTVNVLGEDMIIDATFTKIGEANVDIDFTTFDRPATKTSWEESNPILANSLSNWAILDVLPFLDAENGFSNTVGSVGYAIEKPYKCAYVTANDFSTNAKRDEFIANYKQLLLDSGFTKTDSLDPHLNSDSYEKDGYTIAVGIKLNWNGSETKGVVIAIYGDKIVNGINM